MRKTKTLWRALSVVLLLLLAQLGGCAIRKPPPSLDVGAVVLAPRVQIPPVPAIVQTTQPRPPGFYQSRLLRYFETSPSTPTK